MAFTKLKNRRSTGFTLVELLIVIVVIAILAAITIIAYNGVTQKAKTSQAQSAANSVQQVAELYNTDKGSYPTACSAFRDTTLTTKLPASIVMSAANSAVLIGGGSTSTVSVASGLTDTLGGFATAPSTPSTIGYAVTTSDNSATIANANGGVAFYWDYTDSTAPHVVAAYVGSATNASKLYAPTGTCS